MYYLVPEINQLFVIEPLSITGGSPTLTACTTLYTNAVVSCSGDTQIIMGSGVISFNSNLYTNNEISASTINSSAYYSGGTSLLNIINSNNITGGTFNTTTDTLTLYKTNGNNINVTGLTDYYTTGATLIGNTVYFNRNDLLSAYTLNLSVYSANTFVTGVTFNNNQLLITRNDGVSFNTLINTFTGLTVSGLLSANTVYANIISGNTLSANTIYLSGSSLIDTFIQIGYAIGSATTIVQNGVNTYTGGTPQFPSVNVVSSPIFTSVSAATISATTFYGDGSHLTGILTQDTYVTGGTPNNTNRLYTFTNNTGSTFNVIGLNDINVTGGTYSNGTATFTNNTGGTFNVSGFITNDTRVTGFTYNNNQLLILNSTGGTLGIIVNTMTGLTVNGSLNTTSISATTYQGLPTDIRVTGGTKNDSNHIYTFTNNTGGTFNVIGLTDINVTGGTYLNGVITFTNNTGGTFNVSGLNANDIFVTGGTYSNGIATFTNNTGGTFNINGFYTGTTDVFVTGGTYNSNTGILTFTNNTGGTFVTSGLYTSSNDIYTTGFTYSNNQIILKQTQGQPDLGVLFNTLTGLTVSGDINIGGNASIQGNVYILGTATTINTQTIQSKDNNIDLNYSGTHLTANGGGITILSGVSNTEDSSLTIDENGNWSATTSFKSSILSATTYQNLPLDIKVTGGTYVSNSGIATFTNNTGGTFNVSGFYTNTNDIFVTGGTSNDSNHTYTFKNNTGGTFSVIGLTDISTTGVTYSNNQFTFTNNTGGTFSVLFNTLTGLTSTTISATTYQGLPIDIRITGGTSDSVAKTYIFTNNTGGTFTVTAIPDVFVTGGTYVSNTGFATFKNNTGGTFTVNGFYTNANDIFTTGATYSNNQFTFTNNTGGTYSVLFNTLTGLTVNGSLSATSISASTVSANTSIFTTSIISPLHIGGDLSSSTLTFRTTSNTGSTGSDIIFQSGTNGSVEFMRIKNTSTSAIGGTITYASGYTIHTFTSTGNTTFTPNGRLAVDYLVVGGGGGGGNVDTGNVNAGGGGGAGGMLTGSTTLVASAYTITVGNGGAAEINGGYSSISGVTTVSGGGKGARGNNSGSGAGGTGGSGGGAAGSTIGNGVAGQGNNGGLGDFTFGGSGGGGGAGAVGGAGVVRNGGDGGIGLQTNIGGTIATYAGGGGGGGYTSGVGSSGGSGGGGAGGGPNINGSNATTNTGGGGGAAGGHSSGSAGIGGIGGSGIIIIRYLTSYGSIGIGTSNPTAFLHLTGGTSLTAPLKFTSGNLLTIPETGAMEYDGTNLYFTRTGTTRETIITGPNGIVNAFSANTIILNGGPSAPSLSTTTRLTANTGTTTVYAIPTSAYTSAFFNYTLANSANARSGNIASIWSGSGSSIFYNETSTLDIGSTTGVTFSMSISGSSTVLSVSATTNGWTIKAIIATL